MTTQIKATKSYRCRLCQSVFTIKGASFQTTIEGLNQDLTTNANDWAAGIVALHKCEEYSGLGIADLVGAKVEEVEG